MYVPPVPAEKLFVGPEEDSLRCHKRLPDISKLAVLLRHLIKNWYVVLYSVRVWFNKTKGSIASYPSLAGLVERDRPNCVAPSGDFAPGHPVVFNEVAPGHSDIHHTAAVLVDRPDLTE